FIEPYGRVDVFAEPLHGFGRTGSRKAGAGDFGAASVKTGENGRDVWRACDATAHGLFQQAVGVDVDRVGRGGNGSRGGFSEIEAHDGDRFFGLPVRHALVALFALVDLGTGGDQAQFARPAHGEIVVGKIGGFAEMRIPAFVCADV